MTISMKTAITYLRYAFVALALWFAGLIALTYFYPPTATVLVIGSSEAAVFRAITGSDVALLEGAGSKFHVIGSSKIFVRQLYAAGALLVLPLSNGGCRTLRPSRAS
jgi:hypothetical protein